LSGRRLPTTPYQRYTEPAREAVAAGAKRVCLVASGRGAADRDITRVGNTIAAVKADNPHVEGCACPGERP
jgi:biotin synthase